MFSVCSATSCSSQSQISLHGGFRPCTPSPWWKDQPRCILEDKSVLTFSNGTYHPNISFKAEAIKSFHSNVIDSSDGPQTVLREKLKYVDSTFPSGEENLADFANQSIENSDYSIDAIQPDTFPTVDATVEEPSSVFSSVNIEENSLSGAKSSLDDFLGGAVGSFSSTVDKGEEAIKSSLDKVTSSMTSITKTAFETIDNAFSGVFSAVDQTGEVTSNKFSSLSSDLREASSKATTLSLDLLRRTVVLVEESLSNGASYLVYYYGSAKEQLPPEIRDGLNLYEGKATKVLQPIGAAFEKVYISIEGLERSFGLDPNDPIVPFALFLGTSTSLWVIYWLWRYGGYSGDLSPKLTFELLSGRDKAVLVDIRPEDLRERDGIPDLRRSARSRYASVSLPEVNGSVRKLLKGGKDIDDALIAAVIRNLKTVQDRSMVIVMDADGTRSKGVARSLKKLGIKRPYLVQGGFRSWVKEEGLRIKDLRPQTALTILNEDAEAILEEINPSPLQLVGYGLGFVVALYAAIEWEKTLQLIGVVGIGQTIYRRVATYEDSEDFRKDVSLLLTPARAGAQAVSWAAGKLDTNRNGLPTSPSSSDVQNRVLQAAAKHESQPSDAEEIAPVNENADLSEA